MLLNLYVARLIIRITDSDQWFTCFRKRKEILIGLPSLSNFKIVRLNCICTGLIPFFYQSIAEESAAGLYVDENKLEMRVQLEQKCTISFFGIVS